jgi:hypothetical protein
MHLSLVFTCTSRPGTIVQLRGCEVAYDRACLFLDAFQVQHHFAIRETDEQGTDEGRWLWSMTVVHSGPPLNRSGSGTIEDERRGGAGAEGMLASPSGNISSGARSRSAKTQPAAIGAFGGRKVE